MTLFRQILFWSHLMAGITAGIFIGAMCFTGTVLAFQDEIVSWAERDARQIQSNHDNTRISIEALHRKLGEAQPGFRWNTVTLLNAPSASVAFSAGRENAFYANPYTGEIFRPSSTRVRDFMQTMLSWHRFLGGEGDRRPIGKLINGTCNLMLFFLAVSGLYIWMPRSRSWAGVKAVALFNFKVRGKARDFNWHNTIGLWCAPILILLTLTAVPISFRWGTDFIYQLAGEVPPPQQGPKGSTTSAIEIKRPSPESRPLDYGVIVSMIQKDFPRWEQVVLRIGGPQRGQQSAVTNAPSPHTPTAIAAGTSSKLATISAKTEPRLAAPTNSKLLRERGSVENHSDPQPLSITIRETGSWPRTATIVLNVNPFTGEILKREGFANFSTGRQIRTWSRFLHTGQALGWPGQLVAGLACIGGCFLVYTGFALSWRRFFGKKSAG